MNLYGWRSGEDLGGKERGEIMVRFILYEFFNKNIGNPEKSPKKPPPQLNYEMNEEQVYFFSLYNLNQQRRKKNPENIFLGENRQTFMMKQNSCSH